MIKDFEIWISIRDDYFRNNGLQYIVTKTPLDINNPSIRIDFENEKHLSRMTVWETGECMLEAIDIETEQTVIEKYVVINSNNEFDKYFLQLYPEFETP